MILKSFCGRISLHAGVVILAFTLIEIAIFILISNLHVIPHFPTSVIFIICFLSVMLIAGVIMISAAFKEDRKLCFVAIFLVVFLFVLFLAGSGVSFYNQKALTDYVCVEERCPESLWFAPLRFRKHATHNKTQGHDSEYEEAEESTTERAGRRRRQADENTHSTTLSADQSTETTEHTETTTSEYEYITTEEPEEVDGFEGYVIGVAFVAAIVLFLINTIFLVFCALIVFSYSQELEYTAKFRDG